MSFHDHQDSFERPYGTPLPPGEEAQELESTEAFFTNPRGLFLRPPPSGSECVVPLDHAGPTLFDAGSFEQHDRAVFSSYKNPSKQAIEAATSPTLLGRSPNMFAVAAPILNSSSIKDSPAMRSLTPLESWMYELEGNVELSLLDQPSLAANVPARWKRPVVCFPGGSPQHEIRISSLAEGLKISSHGVSRSLQTSRRVGSSQPPLVIEMISVDEQLLNAQPLVNSRPSTNNLPAAAAMGRPGAPATKKKQHKDTKEDRLYNPFQPPQVQVVDLDEQHRWGHLIETKTHASEDNFGLPNWKSLCKPAILPLTTDKFATQHELSGGDYVEYPNTLFLNMPADASGLESANNVLCEMLCQRLAADYQHVVNPMQQIESEQKNIVPRMWGNNKGLLTRNRSMSERIIADQQMKARKMQTYLFAIHSQCVSLVASHSIVAAPHNTGTKQARTALHSISRRYHKIVLDQATITVTRYVDKKTFTRPNIKLPYVLFAASH
jgi:hypothetical protein